MSIKPSFDDIDAWLAAKRDGYFTVERWGVGWAITAHRPLSAPETILARSPGEANRVRQRLTDEGLCGLIGKGA